MSPSYGTYRPLNSDHLNTGYVDALLRTETYRVNYLIRSIGITSSRLRLYPESFLDIPLLLPPREEQDAIVDFLSGVASATGMAIDRAQRQNELLEEYRTRLIADVVTGKLDVRAAAADAKEPVDGNGLMTDNDAMNDDAQSINRPGE